MAEFDRRSFLGASFGMVAGAAMPEWLVRAFAIQESVSTWRMQQLRSAIERARKTEKPLLVLVVPDHNDRNVRGKWFAVWLSSRCDANLHLPLSCELACASTVELGKELGTKLEGTPMFVLADAPAADAAAAPRTTPIACVLPTVHRRAVELAKLEETRKLGLQAMDEAVQAGVAQHGLTLAEFAARCVRRLDAEQRGELDRWFSDGASPKQVVQLAAAAEACRRIADKPERFAEHLKILRRSITAATLTEPVVGARWFSSGCAGGGRFHHPTKAEDEAREKAEEAYLKELEAIGDNPTNEQLLAVSEKAPVHMIMCGIAVIPALSHSFLEFWTAGD